MGQLKQYIEYNTYVLVTQSGQQVVAVAPTGAEVSIVASEDPVERVHEVVASVEEMENLKRLAVTNDIPAVML